MGIGIYIGNMVGRSSGSPWAPQTEYLTVKAAMTTEPSLADQKIQDAWVKGLKTLGVWDKAILLDNFAGPDNQSGLINWKDPAHFNPTKTVTPTFAAYKGFKGNSIDGSSLNLHFIPSSDGAGFLGQDDITIITAIQDDIDEALPDFGYGGSTKKIKIFSKTSYLSYVTVNGAENYTASPSLTSKRYFGVSRQNGTQREIYKNLVKSIQLQDSVGLCDGNLLACGAALWDQNNKTESFVLIFKYLDEAEVQGVIKLCDSYLKHYDNHLRRYQTNVEFNLGLEGHSLIFSDSFLSDGLEGFNNVVKSNNLAQPGDEIATMAARAATFDSKLIAETATYKNIAAINCGVNDIWDNTAGRGTTAYNALKPYIQARAIAGWKCFVFTMTPSTANGRAAQFEIERGIFNGLLRSDLANTANVYIMDTDTIAALNNPADATYYSDALHFTGAGGLLASQLFTNKIAELYG